MQNQRKVNLDMFNLSIHNPIYPNTKVTHKMLSNIIASEKKLKAGTTKALQKHYKSTTKATIGTTEFAENDRCFRPEKKYLFLVGCLDYKIGCKKVNIRILFKKQ